MKVNNISQTAAVDEIKRAKNEILLYSGIYSTTVESLVREINTFDDSETITIRMHTSGGTTMGGSALLSRLSDRDGDTKIYVDGYAYSMGAFMCCYVNVENVVASEESRFMFHKAAYPSFYEPSESEQRELNLTNENFEKKLKSRLNNSLKAKELISKVFEVNIRNEVYLTASEAMEVGLIGEIKPVKPDIKAFIMQQADIYMDYKNNLDNFENGNNNLNNELMTKEELKAKHPGIYDSIFADGEKSGIDKGKKIEADRVGSFMPYYDAAPEAVIKAIKGRECITETQRTEFSIALHKKTVLEAEKNTTYEDVTTETPEGQGGDICAEIEASIEKFNLTLKK